MALQIGRLGLATAAALAITAGSAQAATTPIACGDSITQDIVVGNGLTNCNSVSGFALTVPSNISNITIDLNGHTIDGTGGASTNTGILANGTNITIKNGIIREFATGVDFFNPGGKVKFTRLISNSLGISVPSGATGTTIKGNTVRNWVTGGIRVQAANVRVTDNGLDTGASDAIVLDGVSGATVSGNDVFGSSSGYGIGLGNTTSTTVSGNQVCHHGDNGINVTGDSVGNSVLNNVVCHSENGIVVFGLTSRRNLVQDNVAYLNNGNGIHVFNAQKTKVFGNRVRHNNASGIFATTPDPDPVQLKNNTGNYNGAWGIEVEQEAINLGGNGGKGNVLGPCFGISC